MKTGNLFAVCDKQTNRAIAIIESSLIIWFNLNAPLFDIKEIQGITESKVVSNYGLIETTMIFIKGEYKDYYIVNSYPNEISLIEAYDIINNIQ